MFLSQALDRLHAFTPEQFNGLADVLSPELNAQCLEDTGTVTLRRRRLSLDMMSGVLGGWRSIVTSP